MFLILFLFYMEFIKKLAHFPVKIGMWEGTEGYLMSSNFTATKF